VPSPSSAISGTATPVVPGCVNNIQMVETAMA
jgi:hypothetical protein